MTHTYHDGLPGYDPAQILHDGCDECEQRGRDVELALANMDTHTFERAWVRAGMRTQHGLDNMARAELNLLRFLGAVQVRLERRGLRIGVLPGDPR